MPKKPVAFAVVVYGAIAIGMSFLTDGIGGHVLQASLSFTGATSGPILGMFIMGALFPFANAVASGMRVAFPLDSQTFVAVAGTSHFARYSSWGKLSFGRFKNSKLTVSLITGRRGRLYLLYRGVAVDSHWHFRHEAVQPHDTAHINRELHQQLRVNKGKIEMDMGENLFFRSQRTSPLRVCLSFSVTCPQSRHFCRLLKP